MPEPELGLEPRVTGLGLSVKNSDKSKMELSVDEV